MAARIIDILLRLKSHTKGAADANAAVDGHRRRLGVLTSAYKTLRSVGVHALHGLASAARTARSLIIGTTVAAAGSVREFVVWNKEAARAWTMMDAGVGEFAALRKEVAKLAPELGVAKSEIGKGWYQALSSGVDKNNIVAFLRTAAKVAVADGSTIETAIDGITTVLNSFKIGADQADKVADLMFKTVRNGKTTFGDLASYISQAAPTAAALGVGIDQVLAGVATLTKQGVPTATAMVQIRNSMLVLNAALGDGWAKTQTLQGALENVAKKGGYSAKALTKMFGRENVSGVLALVGSNARMAAADLAFMRAQGGGLDEAFRKVDGQVGHWPRLWQTIRGYVSDIGQAIDTNIKPAIDAITKKLELMRNSGGFEKIAARIGALIRGLTVGAVAVVNTVLDVISKSSIGGLISASVGALVDMAIALIAEGLRSLKTVVVALAKIAAAALSEEYLKMDIFGRDEEKSARKAAAKNIASLSPEQRKEFGIPKDYKAGPVSPDEFRKREAFIKSLSFEKAVAIATANKDADVDAAIGNAGASFKASRERIGSASVRTMDNIFDRTGIDVEALYKANRDKASEALYSSAPAAAPAAVKKPRAVDPRQFAQDDYAFRKPSFYGKGGAPSDVLRNAAEAADRLADQSEESAKTMETAFYKMSAALLRQNAAAKLLEEKIKNLPSG